jgi:calcyphosin
LGILCFSLVSTQGELSPERLAIVEKAFARLDRDGSGVVTIEDITGVFNAKKHPEVMEGRKTEAQVLTEFLATMEGMCGDKDGKVTFKEFKDYYTELSASIPTDTYFVTMMEVCDIVLGAQAFPLHHAALFVTVSQLIRAPG